MRNVQIVILCFGLISSAYGAGPPLSRCQCNYDKWVGTCVATVSRESAWVRLTSNTQQCSRVDWLIDGNPQMTIVTNGVETEPLLNVGAGAKLVVQACNVCQDAMISDGRPSNPDGTTLPTLARSPFEGTWTGSDRNMFGFSHGINVHLSVQGTTISGTWETQGSGGGVDPVSGSISGTSASVNLGGHGAQGIRLELLDATTLKYTWGFGSGTLKKAL
jgi:hypothetical protein